MRKYVLAALVLAVLGIGISFLLIPTEGEVQQLQARDSVQIDLGNVDVEAEYNQGRRSFPIVNALVDKRITEGDRPAAIKILEEYVTASPGDVNAHKKLAEQYQLAGDYPKYNAQLEIIAQAEPTEQNLKVLSDIYNADKSYVKQIEALKKIIEVTQGANPQYYVDLATIQMLENQSDEASLTVDALRAKHPEFQSYPATRIQVSLLCTKDKLDEAQSVAEAWMVANPADADNLADLVNVVHYTGRDAVRAVALVDARVELLPKSADLLKAYVNASVAAGREDNVYDMLGKIAATGNMPAVLYVTYLELAIKRGDVATAKDVISRVDPLQFDENQALNVLALANTGGLPDVSAALVARFSAPEVSAGKPVLIAVLAVLNKSADQDEKIAAALAAKPKLQPLSRLAQVCAYAGKEACFTDLVKLYPPIDKMGPLMVQDFAQLHIIANRAADIVDAVTLVANANPVPITRNAQLRLASAAGRGDIMQPWLAENGGEAAISQLQEYFYLANDRGHKDVASQLAQILFQREPSDQNREIMIAALLKAGESDKALELLRAQLAQAGTSDGLYLSTLSPLARKDAKYKTELTNYARAALEAGRGDDAQHLNYAYILINNGMRAAVLPVAREKAKTTGGEWKKMLAQLTPAPAGKGGKAVAAKKLTREERVAMANSPTIAIATKRQIGFDLLNEGYRDDATKIFESLAANSPPDSQEVKDLLYLWGGKFSESQLAWVASRAQASSLQDRAAWADIILAGADDSGVLRYAASTSDALSYPPLRQRFFKVLAVQGDGSNFTTNMRSWVDQTSDSAALHDYARTALDFGFKDAAKYTYTRILAVDPSNKLALNQLGTLDFTGGQFSKSQATLDRAVSIPATDTSPQALASDSQAHFFRAELLKRAGKLEEAKKEYATVVQMAQQMAQSGQQLPPDARSRMYSALFHLGRSGEGKQGFEQMLRENPGDKGTLADYMSVLIEYGFTDDAMRVANQYDPNSVYRQRSSALTGNSPDVSAVERFSGGREMKISFAKPLDDKSPIKVMRADKYAWLESQKMGYDSVSISAKPGYVLRFIPTSAQEFAVVPAQAQQASAQEAISRQQDLRLQLLYARIEQETGQQTRARQRLAALQQYYPQEPQLIAYQANVERTNGNPIGAMNMLRHAQALAPENEDYAVLEREIRRTQNTNFIKADHEWRSFGKNNEQITTLSGATRVTDRAEIGFNLRNNEMDTNTIRNAESGLIGDYNTSRQAGEVYAAYYFEDGSRAQGSLFANNSKTGVGFNYALNTGIGRSEVLADLNRPYWDFVEAAYEEATRSRVGFRHSAMLTPNTSLGLEGSMNQYNTHLEDNVIGSGLVRANVVHALRQSQPYLAMGYGFDGEYLHGNDKVRIDNRGNAYKLLPLVSREVHAITGSMQYDLTPSTHTSLVGGWAYDRLSEQGPLIEGRITQDITDRVEAGVRARYGLQTNDSANNATNVGAHMQYKF
jgi:protein involved in temperature-dependent protein secretion